MRCPRGDNLLIDQKPRHSDGLALHYLACPTCKGTWLSSFDANYIQSIDLASDETPIQLASKNPAFQGYQCPQCRRSLERTTGDNIPPDILVYHCPDGHGYFFPAGELKKFKIAQETKIAYHERWHVPLASVASAMLMTVVGLVLSAGLIAGVIEGQHQQTITSQAEEIIQSQKAYVDSQSQSVTIIALTTEKTVLTVVVDGQEYPMLAPDGKSHVFRLTNVSGGEHRYFFRFQKGGLFLKSSVYSFSSF